jgi:hypothetical protein
MFFVLLHLLYLKPESTELNAKNRTSQNSYFDTYDPKYS